MLILFGELTITANGDLHHTASAKFRRCQGEQHSSLFHLWNRCDASTRVLHTVPARQDHRLLSNVISHLTLIDDNGCSTFVTTCSWRSRKVFSIGCVVEHPLMVSAQSRNQDGKTSWREGSISPQPVGRSCPQLEMPHGESNTGQSRWTAVQSPGARNGHLCGQAPKDHGA